MKRSVAAVPAVRDPKIRILLLLTALLLGSSECFHRFFHDGAVACGGAAAVFRIAPFSGSEFRGKAAPPGHGAELHSAELCPLCAGTLHSELPTRGGLDLPLPVRHHGLTPPESPGVVGVLRVFGARAPPRA